MKRVMLKTARSIDIPERLPDEIFHSAAVIFRFSADDDVLIVHVLPNLSFFTVCLVKHSDFLELFLFRRQITFRVLRIGVFRPQFFVAQQAVGGQLAPFQHGADGAPRTVAAWRMNEIIQPRKAEAFRSARRPRILLGRPDGNLIKQLRDNFDIKTS